MVHKLFRPAFHDRPARSRVYQEQLVAKFARRLPDMDFPKFQLARDRLPILGVVAVIADCRFERGEVAGAYIEHGSPPLVAACIGPPDLSPARR